MEYRFGFFINGSHLNHSFEAIDFEHDARVGINANIICRIGINHRAGTDHCQEKHGSNRRGKPSVLPKAMFLDHDHVADAVVFVFAPNKDAILA
ncbi:hypothetical protein SDC9_162885 [bioreactor metagenome]|uniref:Uncharacterized protein n=1 Tax=bioreactor metagenome TaxID=1076179 RepID=A0A645FMD5_9ZZZZ